MYFILHSSNLLVSQSIPPIHIFLVLQFYSDFPVSSPIHLSVLPFYTSIQSLFSPSPRILSEFLRTQSNSESSTTQFLVSDWLLPSISSAKMTLLTAVTRVSPSLFPFRPQLSFSVFYGCFFLFIILSFFSSLCQKFVFSSTLAPFMPLVASHGHFSFN